MVDYSRLFSKIQELGYNSKNYGRARYEFHRNCRGDLLRNERHRADSPLSFPSRLLRSEKAAFYHSARALNCPWDLAPLYLLWRWDSKSLRDQPFDHRGRGGSFDVFDLTVDDFPEAGS